MDSFRYSLLFEPVTFDENHAAEFAIDDFSLSPQVTKIHTFNPVECV